MSRGKGARRRARRDRLLALRAELCILLEDKLHPGYMKLNARDTEELLDHYKTFGQVPLKFGTHYAAVWAEEHATLDDKLDAVRYSYERALQRAMFTGTGVVCLTTSQHSGTIMDMDSGNASGHTT